jgi:hypothetical protein
MLNKHQLTRAIVAHYSLGQVVKKKRVLEEKQNKYF